MKLHALAAFLLFSVTAVFAADDARLQAVTAADDARVAAMKNPDAAKLGAIFSDELHYAHSSGTVDTKATFIDALVSGKSKYVGIDYTDRAFTFPCEDIALMNGRARVQVHSAKGQMDAILAYLAVWRLEDGKWRFLAWQSCKVPPPADASAK